MSQHPSDDPSAAPEGSGAGGEGHVPTPAAVPDGVTAESMLDVAEFNSRLGAHIEDHALEFEYVVGDVSDCTEARSGHTYFGLTGADAAIDCALWSYGPTASPRRRKKACTSPSSEVSRSTRRADR